MKRIDLSRLRVEHLCAAWLVIYAILLVLQLNLRPLQRYPNWDSFWTDTMMVGNLAALRQALLAFELPAITPYVDFGWSSLGSATLVQSYLNPIHWLVLALAPANVIIVRTIALFALGAVGSFFLLRRITGNVALSFLGGVMFCALPMNVTLVYGTSMIAFVYCTPVLLCLIHAFLERKGIARLCAFAMFCTFATSAGDVYGLVALPCVIGMYTFFIAWHGRGETAPSAFAWSASLIAVWALASAFYIVPAAYDAIQNLMFADDLAAAQLLIMEAGPLSWVAKMLRALILPSLFVPVDAGSTVLYLPAFCLIAIVAGFTLPRDIFRHRRMAAGAFFALAAICVASIAETFALNSIPSLAVSGAFYGWIQIKLVPYLLLLAALICLGEAMRGPQDQHSPASQPGPKLMVFAFVLASLSDIGLFALPALGPANLASNPFFVNHVSHRLPFPSPNLIRTAWLEDMWPVLPIANAALAATLLAFARTDRKTWTIAGVAAVVPLLALGAIFYASLQQDLRNQQSGGSWTGRSDYRIAAYAARRDCIARLVDRADPDFRTLYAGRGPSGRSWKLIAETELHVGDREKVLFSSRQTTHPTTALVRNSFSFVREDRWFNLWPPTVTDLREHPALVRLIGAKWVISADARIDDAADPNWEGWNAPALSLVGDDFNFAWFHENAADLAGKDVELEVLMRADVAEKFAAEIYDGTAVTTSVSHRGNGRWQWLTVNRRVAPDAKRVSFRVARAAQLHRSDRVDIAAVRLTVDGIALPVTLDAFSDWSPGKPLPAGWGFDGGETRATVVKPPAASALVYRGRCDTKPSPLNEQGAYEDGPMFVYELANPLGVAFVGERFETLPSADILRRMSSRFWDDRAVLVEPDELARVPQQVDIAPASSSATPAQARITADAFNRMTVTTAADTMRPLVLTMTYRPFWSATIDGISAPVLKVYGGFMAVVLPAGQHTVVFKYVPWDGYAGLLITLATLGLMGPPAWRRWRHERDPSYASRYWRFVWGFPPLGQARRPK